MKKAGKDVIPELRKLHVSQRQWLIACMDDEKEIPFYYQDRNGENKLEVNQVGEIIVNGEVKATVPELARASMAYYEWRE